MQTQRSQRWRERRRLFVADEAVIDPQAYTVELIEPAVARAFVAAHHYLPNYPAAHLAVGLFARSLPRGAAPVGVAVFGVPAVGAVVTAHAGLSPDRGCVLSRLLLLDTVPQNGESFFVARAFGLLRRARPSLEAVVSYADPSAGHIGRVYAALSGAYRGRTRERASLRVGDIAISGRTLSKIRLDERGSGGAIDQLVRCGAPRPDPGEAPPAWLDRLRRERILVAQRQPGLFVYSFALTRAARRAARHLARHPYPTMLPAPEASLPLVFAAGKSA